MTHLSLVADGFAHDVPVPVERAYQHGRAAFLSGRTVNLYCDPRRANAWQRGYEREQRDFDA